MRAITWDLAAVVLLSFYGPEVCPLLERVGPLDLGWRLAAVFALSHGLGVLAERASRGAPSTRALSTYLVHLGRYLLVGLAMVGFNAVALQLNVGSGMRLLVGTLALGHFVAVDLALARERAMMAELEASGAASSTLDRPRSIVRRLAAFAVITVALVLFVLVLVVRHDLELVAASGAAAVGGVRRAVMIDAGVVGVVLVALVLNLIAGFSQNLSRLFANETRVLDAVRRGDLQARVPVVTEDEFGVIAAHTNRMIEGLEERARMKDALGKIVSPDVARELLDGGNGLSLGGTRRTLTFLFSDIRGFTTWSEGTEPEALVKDLNRYLTEMVAIVHEEGGVVDKFIGDGLMAVFGLSSPDTASSAAARAALRMETTVARMAASFVRPIEIGVGLHRGEVVAGNVGSPDRMEFTFIGDVVNTAARLESLTRSLDAVVLASRAVVDALPVEERARWESRGAHALKGRAATVEVLSPQAVHGGDVRRGESGSSP